VGHTAIHCWYMMDEAYNKDPPSAAFCIYILKGRHRLVHRYRGHRPHHQ
jgi:hypothetical protein